MSCVQCVNYSMLTDFGSFCYQWSQNRFSHWVNSIGQNMSTELLAICWFIGMYTFSDFGGYLIAVNHRCQILWFDKISDFCSLNGIWAGVLLIHFLGDDNEVEVDVGTLFNNEAAFGQKIFDKIKEFGHSSTYLQTIFFLEKYPLGEFSPLWKV